MFGRTESAGRYNNSPQLYQNDMNSKWLEHLTKAGGRPDDGQITDFGNLQDELKAASSATVVAPLTHFGLIRASGEDAAKFLHSLLSNDVLDLERNRAERCGFCSPKGRLLADFLIWREDNDYLLQLSADILPALLKKLGMYVLRSKVKLSDASEDTVLIGLSGSGAADVLDIADMDIPSAPLSVQSFPGGTVMRLDERRYQIALRVDLATTLWNALTSKATPVGIAAWRWLEIEAGVARITAATQEEFVPQMTNLDLIGGLSFKKGCYPGQEVVARTKYLGKVKRRTFRAKIEAECPTAGTNLFSPDLPEQSCGKIIDAVAAPDGGCDALASMLLTSAETGQVRVGSKDGPLLHFLSLPYSLE